MSGHSQVVQPAVYVRTLLMLMVLMTATIVAAKWHVMHLGIVWNLIIALAIAGCKVYFIMTNFMHVKHGSPLVKVLALIGFSFLVIMFLLFFNDYTTREWHSPFNHAANPTASQYVPPGQVGH
ncbi:MAG: hypothetical protein GC168_14220 [Candidatus Hydrogenedens sp.]|nr:hypothetical protein [Candidatus Hydrogenedens sp.]